MFICKNLVSPMDMFRITIESILLCVVILLNDRILNNSFKAISIFTFTNKLDL